MKYQQTIYNIARRKGVPDRMAELIAAQAAHETGNFTSAVWKDCGNAFGYSAPGGKNACPGHLFYKKYDNLDQSITEVIDWLKRRQKEGTFPAFSEVTSPAQYAQLLKNNNYYTDNVQNYAGGLSRWFRQFGFSIGTSIILIGLVVAAVLATKNPG